MQSIAHTCIAVLLCPCRASADN